jgi:ferredoxin
MAYVITEACVSKKDAACVGVCPVNCIHPAPDEPGFGTAHQLYIDPTECIGCDACAAECPWGAPYPIDELPPRLVHAVATNAAFYAAPDAPATS